MNLFPPLKPLTLLDRLKILFSPPGATVASEFQVLSDTELDTGVRQTAPAGGFQTTRPILFTVPAIATQVLWPNENRVSVRFQLRADVPVQMMTSSFSPSESEYPTFYPSKDFYDLGPWTGELWVCGLLPDGYVPNLKDRMLFMEHLK